MKRYLVGVSLLILGSAALAVPADKVTICHATSSDSNPWVRTVVSANAIAGHFENNGTTKAGHEGDVLLQGEVDCPTTVVTPPAPTPPPAIGGGGEVKGATTALPSVGADGQ